MPLLPGDEVAGYVIEREIGRGGMGSVYVAKHPRLPRRVALKLLSLEFTDDPQYRIRFEREADIAARFDHRNIVSVLDRGTHEGRLWIAMQYIDGMDAAQALLIAGGSGLGVARSAHIVSEVATALDVAHHHRLLHRDVKPANILLAPGAHPDDAERVLLSDFGISKVADEGPNLTGTGNLLATLAYAAPERILARPSDHRADIYSLGCVLYELLVGTQPFPAQNSYEAMQAHLDAVIPLPSARRPEVPPQIDDTVVKAMAKDPSDRYSTAREMAIAIRSTYPGGSAQASTGGFAPPFTGPTSVYQQRVPVDLATETLTTFVNSVPHNAVHQNAEPQDAAARPPGSIRSTAPTTLSTDGQFRPPGPPPSVTGPPGITEPRRRRRPALQWVGVALIVLIVAAGATMSVWRPWFSTSPTESAGGTDQESSDSAASTSKPSSLSTSAASTAAQNSSTAGTTSTNTSTTSRTTSKTSTTTETTVYTGALLKGNYTFHWVEVGSTGDVSPTPGETFTSTQTIVTECTASGCYSPACNAEGCFNFEESALVWRESYDYTQECIFDDTGAGSGVVVGYHREMELRIAEQTSFRITLLTGTAVVTQTTPCDETDEVNVVTYEVSLTAQK